MHSNGEILNLLSITLCDLNVTSEPEKVYSDITARLLAYFFSLNVSSTATPYFMQTSSHQKFNVNYTFSLVSKIFDGLTVELYILQSVARPVFSQPDSPSLLIVISSSDLLRVRCIHFS